MVADNASENPQRVTLTIYVDAEVYAEACRHAKRHGLSLEQALGWAINCFAMAEWFPSGREAVWINHWLTLSYPRRNRR